MILIKIHGITLGFTHDCQTEKGNTMKKKTHEILTKIRTHIFSENFQENYRATKRDFIRKRLITLPVLTLLILNLMRKSLQAELNSLDNVIPLPIISKQVFSAARKKLLPTAFVELNNKMIQEFYSDNTIKLYLGFRLVIVDGSTLQLPESEELKEKFGVCSNQNDKGMVMARTSQAYDPLNGITLDAIIAPYKANERAMAFDHIVKILPSNCAGDLYLFDRGYASINLIFFLNLHGKDFVMRCGEGWLAIVNQVRNSRKRDVILEISPDMLSSNKKKEFQKLFPNVGLKSSIKLRVLVIKLSTGEEEVLITSLLDKSKYNYKMFKALYHLRWGVEENYKFHKVRIEIENFSGKTTHAIEQDFHATVFTGNVRALLAEEAEDEALEIPSKKQSKYHYKINKNISIGILKNEILGVLFYQDRNIKAFCEKMKKLMKKSTVPIRPGRTFARVRKTRRKYHMNMRRAI